MILKFTIRRRSWRRTMKTNRTLKVAVGSVMKIDGNQVLDMVVEKAPPRLRRWLSTPNHVLGHGGLGNGYAELREFAVHAGCSPQRIGSRHVPEHFADFRSDTGSTGSSPPTLPSPVTSEPGAMPTDDGVGLDDDEHPVPVSPDSAQDDPEASVDIRKPGPFHRPAEDGELVPESEILNGERTLRLER